MTLQDLRQRADARGATLFVLAPGADLPYAERGPNGEVWLCIAAEENTSELISAASARGFSRIYVLAPEEKDGAAKREQN